MKKKDLLRNNKIVAAILSPFLVIILASYFSAYFFPPEGREINAVKIAVADISSGATVTEVEQTQPVSTFLAHADAERGQKIFRLCAACHTITKGGDNKVGPNLWGILGKRSGEADNFKYSNTMKEYASVWSYENLSDFIASPSGFFDKKRINMTFEGISKVQTRAHLILYMRAQSDNPLPLPYE